MRTGASILLSFAMGALVTIGLVGWSSTGDAVQPPVAATRVAGEPTRPAAVTSEPAAPTPPRIAEPARIVVPRLRLKATIGTSLNLGPAWWPVTGRPGGGETIAIAGHRTTHTRPFYSLDRLRTGDSIYLHWGGRKHAYRVSGRRILSAKQLHIGDARGHEVLLLSACHPRGSARQRIVVYAWPQV